MGLLVSSPGLLPAVLTAPGGVASREQGRQWLLGDSTSAEFLGDRAQDQGRKSEGGR